MSGRRRGSRAPWIIIIVLVAALAAAGTILYRIYPEYQRLRTQEAAPGSEAADPEYATPSKDGPKPVVARLYFARIVEGQQRMVAISRELPAGLPPAQAALEELLRGEVPRGCDRPLPRGTELHSVRVADGVALADFSKQLASGFRGGSDNEGVTIYAIVNTLTTLPGIDGAQILIEGEPIQEIGGHLYLGEPLAFDDELVVPYP